VNYLLEHSVHQGVPGMRIENEIFLDLDFVDDVKFLAEMLEVLILALSVMQEEGASFGLPTNWSKTKILQSGSSSSSTVQVADGQVEVVDSFLAMQRYASTGTSYDPVSVCLCLSVTSRCSIEMGRCIELVFGM